MKVVVAVEKAMMALVLTARDSEIGSLAVPVLMGYALSTGFTCVCMSVTKRSDCCIISPYFGVHCCQLYSSALLCIMLLLRSFPQ